jgi:hypothetical protein
MSQGRQLQQASSYARSGVVVCATLVILGIILLAQQTLQAEAGMITEKAVAGFQTTDKLILTVSLANPKGKLLAGALRVEVLGPQKESLAQSEREISQTDLDASYRFELPASKLPTQQLLLRCQIGDEKVEMPLNRVLVVKAHETSLTSSQEFYAGSPATLRCEVHGVKSVAETVPLVGADVDVRLRAKDGKLTPLAAKKTGADGTADIQFKVPEVPAGQYTLLVETKSNLGQEKLERAVQVKAGAKILLVTDKPLYQPGQVMHIRALALRPFDLKPVERSELLFEVEDAKGNKVFKRAYTTSAFGVAAVDFQLADEVNMGDYRVRAILGEQQADKTVTVKRYVLPKFKSELTADKPYYLPKEKIHAELQTDYFFGKPVARGKVKVTASTFDLQFREFQTWEGQTDANGHAKFEIQLPDYFVGQPLQKGDALIRLEVKVTDTADHSETISRSYPVSDQPIRISLIPESGRLVPAMENRVFAAAIYPDGSPAACEVTLWTGRVAGKTPLDRVKTNEAGLAEFRFTPEAAHFRQGQWEQQNLEMVGGQTPAIWGPKMLYDLYAEAKDAKGHRANTVAEITSEPLGGNVLLRLDKAIYRGGDALQVEIRSSAGLPTVYLDVVKGGQTMLSSWMDVKDSKASYRLDLPAELFGTLEVHAYQMLQSGEIIRDSRVIYVQPRNDLKIDVHADKDVHLPGETGHIRFQVTDSSGRPTAAALGVLIVDEAVYALQEMQPGLEKVYFTLQEELLKPKVQVVYRPRETIDGLVREAELPAEKQQIAEVLLTSVKPKPPARWQVAPDVERRHKVEDQVQQIGWALLHYVNNTNRPFMQYDQAAKRWVFKPDLLKEVASARYFDPSALKDPFGNEWTLDDLARLEKHFTPDQLAWAVTQSHMGVLVSTFVNYTFAHQAQWLKDGKWNLPDTVLEDAVQNQKLDKKWLLDAWGEPIKLLKQETKVDHQPGWSQLDYYQLVSAGPDRQFGTKDDVKMVPPSRSALVNWWWTDDIPRLVKNQRVDRLGRAGPRGQLLFLADGVARNGVVAERMLAAPALLRAGAAAPGCMPVPLTVTKAAHFGAPSDKEKTGAAAPTRIREYFPETLFWQPALITDDRGFADLSVPFADSITTWRLTASASSQGGLLGGVSAPLRVFQDFFVDLDLPVSLTQNDEVSFPVAVYNYLKTPQTVKLELQKESWFELMDEGGFTRSLDLKPNEVTAIKYRIRARRIGFQPLTVKASGSKMSDAIKRTIEVVPDGSRVEKVVTDRLTGKVLQTIEIPEHAIPDASKILVKLYPGVFSQVLEGTEGMLRMPFG